MIKDYVAQPCTQLFKDISRPSMQSSSRTYRALNEHPESFKNASRSRVPPHPTHDRSRQRQDTETRLRASNTAHFMRRYSTWDKPSRGKRAA